MELSAKTFSQEIIPDLVEENKLVTEYIDLVSSGMIEFNGEKLSISQMGKYVKSNDRDTRKKLLKKYGISTLKMMKNSVISIQK